MNTANVDQAEVNKFSRSVEDWWDTSGDFRTLHMLNPLRVKFIEDYSPIENQTVLDVGCGGGILTEALAAKGAVVTGIDASEQNIFAAKRHMQFSEMNIDYVYATAEEFAAQQTQKFDIITCMELLEHVPDPPALIKACAAMLKQDGHLFMSTLNRTPKSWALGIVAAEYLLNIVPRGTHQHRNFIRPSELFEWSEQAGLRMSDLTGLHFNPLAQTFRLGPGVDINYFVRCQRT